MHQTQINYSEEINYSEIRYNQSYIRENSTILKKFYNLSIETKINYEVKESSI
jgi:hypothetical protein